ncbi:hypothetical protein MTR67_017489 [Solanum verrucosum]|uniref:Lipoprotein n=1 Tax=Solanum verrucosum TaxID=315347 RepID=A0AAF0QI13_SOLVR|nr:hypothetical protein MTR67_017489 [Solanum verrucosum]
MSYVKSIHVKLAAVCTVVFASGCFESNPLVASHQWLMCGFSSDHVVLDFCC